MWYALVVVSWWHATFLVPAVTWWLDTVIGTWEESCKVFVREAFAAGTRLINGAAAWVSGVGAPGRLWCCGGVQLASRA